MNTIFYMNDLLKQIDFILETVKEVEHQKKNVYTTQHSNKEYYYFRLKGKTDQKPTYLGTADSNAVKQIKIEQMQSSLIDVLDFDRDLIVEFTKKFRDFDACSLEKYVAPCLRDIPVDFIVDERFRGLWNWANSNYEKNSSPFPKRKIYAVDGTRIRSKGECMWYNDFKAMWVPMRYDPVMEFVNPKPGALGPGTVIYKSPDFLIKCIDGTYIIVEHLGFLMDDKYAADFKEKLQIYEANGFVLGVNLFVLSDDMDGGTDSMAIHEMVEQIKWKVYHGTGLPVPEKEW